MYEKIEQMLKAKGKTFYWLHKKTGIAQSVFSMMRKRGSNLGTKNLFKVADALKVSVTKLMGD